MTSAYLASGFNRRERLRALALKLEMVDVDVTSSWIYLDDRPDRHDGQWDEFARKVAGINLVDLIRSNTLIIDGNGIRPTNHGGVHTELGWALAKDWPIYLIGHTENTFAYLPNVVTVPDEEALLAFFKVMV